MAVGGYNGNFLDDVEYVDMYNENFNCPKPAAYPFKVADAVGFFFRGQPWVCGGDENPTTTRRECFAFDVATNTWVERASMSTGRVFAAANPIKNGAQLWITGKSRRWLSRYVERGKECHCRAARRLSCSVGHFEWLARLKEVDAGQ